MYAIFITLAVSLASVVVTRSGFLQYFSAGYMRESVNWSFGASSASVEMEKMS